MRQLQLATQNNNGKTQRGIVLEAVGFGAADRMHPLAPASHSTEGQSYHA